MPGPCSSAILDSERPFHQIVQFGRLALQTKDKPFLHLQEPRNLGNSAQDDRLSLQQRITMFCNALNLQTT